MLIKPHKMIIELDSDNTFKDAVLMYRIQDNNGVVSNQYKTLSIKSVLATAQMNDILDKAIQLTEQQEGV
jgi:hypothetical protein